LSAYFYISVEPTKQLIFLKYITQSVAI